MKNYIGIIRDHSGSMAGIAQAAAKDYNNNISAIKEASQQENQDTIVSVIKCGVGYSGNNEQEVINSSVNSLKPLNESAYTTDGGSTPLFRAVRMLIDQFEKLPDAKDPQVSFIIMAVTDGGDNVSNAFEIDQIVKKMDKLQATDHWTFVFRVPRKYIQTLEYHNIPVGNIQGWDQTAKGMEESSKVTTQAFKSFYTQRSAGQTSTKNFFKTDLSNVTKEQIKSVLNDISKEVKFFKVTSADDGSQIRDFMNKKTKNTFVKGEAFYQLDKKEKIQQQKLIAIRDRTSKQVFSGHEARTVLGLPYNSGTITVSPGDHGKFEIYVQSTSVNRKVFANTEVLYWKGLKQLIF